MMDKQPELLAPVGSIEAFGVALKAGADAFYLGTTAFNARMRARNLSLREIRSMLKMAHRNHKKIYLTLNCLVEPDEFPRLKKICDFCLVFGIDGIIIQDLGLMRFLHEFYPSIPLHASTQMLAYNLESHQILNRYGVTRAILPRELSLNEIRYLTERSPLELEIFIHGAMCFAFSGGCLFSHFLFNESGNRGLCRQVCRFNFNRRGRPYYPFAMKDLNTSAIFDQIRQIPLAALKIEGRLRSLAYLEETVRNYRRLLDGDTTPPRFFFSRSASSGYLLRNSYQELTTPDENTQFGKSIGLMRSAHQRTIQANLQEPVVPGDSIRLVSTRDDFTDNFLIIHAQSNDPVRWKLKLDHDVDPRFREGKNRIYLINKRFDQVMTLTRLEHEVRSVRDLSLTLKISPAPDRIQLGLHLNHPAFQIPDFRWDYRVDRWSDQDTDPGIVDRIMKETSNPLWAVDQVVLENPLPMLYKDLKRMKREMLTAALSYFQKHIARHLADIRISPFSDHPVLSTLEAAEMTVPNALSQSLPESAVLLIDPESRSWVDRAGLDRTRFYVRLPLFVSPMDTHFLSDLIERLKTE